MPPINATSSARVQTTRLQDTPTTQAERGFLDAVSRLDDEAWRYAAQQRSSGGEVTPAHPGLWGAYDQFLKSQDLQDTPALRGVFLDQLIQLRGWAGAKGVGSLTTDDVARFRGEYALQHVQDSGGKVGANDTWVFRALLDPRSGLDPKARKSLQDQLKGQTLPGTGGATRKPLQGTTQSNKVRTGDEFVRTSQTQRTNASRNVAPQTPKRFEEDDVIRSSQAPTPADAMAEQLLDVSRNEQMVSTLRERARTPGPIIGDNISERTRQSYREFVQTKNLADNEATQREFVTLLDARRDYAARKGLSTMNAAQEREFLKETALARLQMRAQLGQPLSLRPGEGWMINALADPAASLSSEDLSLLGKFKTDRGNGLPESLAEIRFNAQKRQSQFEPVPGQPYTATLTVDDIFGQGDPQVNAFSLAARAGGYSEQETRLAMDWAKQNGIALYVKQGVPNEPLITQKSQATTYQRGDQEFANYRLTSQSALALRDARYALKHGYASVQEYRNAMENTLSSRTLDLGTRFVENVQSLGKSSGAEDVPVLGSAVRGAYDALRELNLVTANGAKVAEMFGTEVRLFKETGNLFVRINDDVESREYFDKQTARAESTFVQLGETYQREELSPYGQVIRDLVASTPKMAVSAVPGAVIYYNGLKNLNRDINEFAKETTVDLASMLVGMGAGRVVAPLANKLVGGVSKTAPSLIDSTVGRYVVRQVVDRGTSAVSNAAQNVLMDMGPAALQKLMSKGGKPLSAKEEQALAEQLTFRAFQRSVASGIISGLIMPDHHTQVDQAMLARKDVSIASAIMRTTDAGGNSRFFAMVNVPESKGATKTPAHLELVEVSPDNPKVKAELQKEKPRDVSQQEVDAGLAASRYEHRLGPQEQAALVKWANEYAKNKVLADAEKGNTPTADVVPLKPALTDKVDASTTSKPTKLPPTSSTPTKLPPGTTSSTPSKLPSSTTPSPTAMVPTTPKVDTPAKPPAESVAPADVAKVSQEVDAVFRDDDIPDENLSAALVEPLERMGANPVLCNQLRLLADGDVQQLMGKNREPFLQVALSKDPKVEAYLDRLITRYGNRALSAEQVKAELQEVATKGVPPDFDAPRVPSSTDLKLESLLKLPPPKPPTSATPASVPPLALTTYRTDAAVQGKMKELIASSNVLQTTLEDVQRQKRRFSEMSGIPDEDLVALRAYTGENPKFSYRSVNEALKSKSPADLARLDPLIKSASSALNQLPPYTGTVYRGIKASDYPAGFLDKYVEGAVNSEGTFHSTAKSEQEARTLRKADTLFVINSRGGGKDIENISQSSAETEVLFPPGTNFRVLKREIEPGTGVTVIYLDEVR